MADRSDAGMGPASEAAALCGLVMESTEPEAMEDLRSDIEAQDR